MLLVLCIKFILYIFVETIAIVLQLKTIQMKKELEKLKQENKELKNDIWNWEKKYKLLFETYTEFINQVNSK